MLKYKMNKMTTMPVTRYIKIHHWHSVESNSVRNSVLEDKLKFPEVWFWVANFTRYLKDTISSVCLMKQGLVLGYYVRKFDIWFRGRTQG